jgi:hypothetical protein
VIVPGSGFDASVTATVGGEPALVSVTDENTLTLKVPAAAAGLGDILLTSGDEATYTMGTGIILPQSCEAVRGIGHRQLVEATAVPHLLSARDGNVC